MGYGLGGINWDVTSLGIMLGGHLHATFTLITIIFVICVICTITSFKEIPLELLERDQYRHINEPKVNFVSMRYNRFYFSLGENSSQIAQKIEKIKKKYEEYYKL